MKSQLFDTEQGEQFPSFLSNLDLHVQVMFLIMVKLHYRIWSLWVLFFSKDY